jgi:transcriptional regulator with XRE-family HTH domain
MTDALGQTHTAFKNITKGMRKITASVVKPPTPQSADKKLNDGSGDDDLDKHIPHRLKALRTALGVSAATLDRQTGFNSGTIGRLERGDQRVYAAHLYRISTVTGISIGYFFEPTNSGSPQGGTSEELEKQRLLRAYMDIADPGLQRDVFELIETLAGEYDAKAP